MNEATKKDVRDFLAKEIARVFEAEHDKLEQRAAKLHKDLEDLASAIARKLKTPPAEAPENRELREAVERWMRARWADPRDTELAILDHSLASLAKTYATAELALLEAADA